jgi:hypothetical protein
MVRGSRSRGEQRVLQENEEAHRTERVIRQPSVHEDGMGGHAHWYGHGQGARSEGQEPLTRVAYSESAFPAKLGATRIQARMGPSIVESLSTASAMGIPSG